tara:strand:- start:1205 stop:1531 length:327 start_codon:yes stop_codon:yes gene_type:complete
MNSTFDNCILKNAIYKNGNPHNEHEINDLMYLKALRELPQNVVNEYYSRSINIINRLRANGSDTIDTWKRIDNDYVNAIIADIRSQSYAIIPSRIRAALDDLEKLYGV